MSHLTEPHADRRAVKFPPHSEFRTTLQRRVNDYFIESGQTRFGGFAMVKKSMLIGGWVLTSYLYLLLGAQNFVDASLAMIALAFGIAGVGFAVQHDGGHGTYSSNPRISKIAARSLDFIGGSSTVWNFKHNILHHQFPNIPGIDADLQDGTFMRLAPQQKRKPMHRLQHIYAWFLYGLLPVKWHFYDDFVDLIRSSVGGQKMARPSNSDLRFAWTGKAIFFTWALLIPALLHGPGVAIIAYLSCTFILGVMLATVFQLAHCVEETHFFAAPHSKKERMELEWMQHQLVTTCNFATRSKFLTWFLGGLNFQVEHHLFPKISHIHYPKIAPIVQATCAEFDVDYLNIDRLTDALASHYRFLRDLGRPENKATT